MATDKRRLHLEARHSWADAARQQVRVIAALVRRETRVHFGETRLGYLWAIIEPTLHLIVYALLFHTILRRATPLGGSLTLFMLTGLMTYFLFSKMATYLAHAVDSNRALLNLPPVKPIDVIVARAILETATYLFVGFVLLVGLTMFDAADVAPHNPVQLAGAIASTVGLGFGIGVVNMMMRAFARNWMTFFGLLLSPVFFLSGIWFLPSQIPPPFRDYILYNPLLHNIMWVRSGFYRDYHPSELDRGYAVWWAVLAVVLGLAFLRVARRKLLEPT